VTGEKKKKSGRSKPGPRQSTEGGAIKHPKPKGGGKKDEKGGGGGGVSRWFRYSSTQQLANEKKKGGKDRPGKNIGVRRKEKEIKWGKKKKRKQRSETHINSYKRKKKRGSRVRRFW